MTKEEYDKLKETGMLYELRPGSTGNYDEDFPCGHQETEYRIARCCHYGHTHEGKKCTSERPSKMGLAFFKRQQDKEYDQYYCGCWGWD